MAFKTTYSQYNSTTGLFSTEGSLNLTTIPSNETKITASDAATSDQFGSSVAVGDNRIVVGAYRENSNQGSAYIFNLDGTQLAKITASDGAASDQFGTSVAVGNGRIVVGAHTDNIGATLDQGSAYIFDLDGTQLAKITASDGAEYDRFGNSVAVGSGRIVVGAIADDDSGLNSGSVYIFDLNGTQITKITASDTAAQDNFGSSVAVGNGRIVVGATGDDDNGSQTGAAYIFDLDGNELAKITASDGAANDYFGTSVAVGCGRIVVGRTQGFSPSGRAERGAAYIYDLDGNLIKTVFDSTQAFDQFGRSVAIGNGKIVVSNRDIVDQVNGIGRGGVFVYDLDGTQLTKINASDGADYDEFGFSVAIGNGRIVAGANGDDDNGAESGSAYIYNTPNVKDIFSIIDK